MKTLKMKIIDNLKGLAAIGLFVIGCHDQGMAQGCELVTNGNFETGTCPSNWTAVQQGNVSGWWQPTGGTSDYFSTCGTNGLSVPGNGEGYQAAHGGNAYVGAWVAGNTYEYIETSLNQTMVAGKTYSVKMYVSIAEATAAGTNVQSLAVLFSSNAVSGTGTAKLNFTPSVTLQQPSGQSFTNQTIWVLLCGTYVAQGGEKYMTIGNSQGTTGIYLYMDDVSVREWGANAGPDRVICKNGSQLGAGCANPTAQYSWSPSTGLSCTNCFNPIATPTGSSQITYTLTVSDPSGCAPTVSDAIIITNNSLTASITGNTNFCSGAPLSFTGNDGVGTATSYYWAIEECTSTGTVINGGYIWNNNWNWYSGVPGAFTFPVQPACNKYYKITLAVNNSCYSISSATQVIYISCSPVVSVTGTQTICATSGVNLYASGANTYTWNPTGKTGNEIIAHPATDCAPNCGPGPSYSTTYTVTGTSNGCSSSATITITALPQTTSIDISTGSISPGNPMAYGDPDPEWKIRGTPGVTSNYTTAFSSLTNSTAVKDYINSWIPDDNTNERWISSNHNLGAANNAPPSAGSAPGSLYWYENRFTFPAMYNSNYQMTVNKISADNMLYLYLNSTDALIFSTATWDYALNSTLNTFQNFYSFNLTNQSKFKTGENVLQIGVFNQLGSDTKTGLILYGTVTASCPVVEPCLGCIISNDGQNNTTSVNEDTDFEKAFSVYPNPFNSDFTAVYNGEGSMLIEVMDVLGKIYITQQGIGGKEQKIQANDLPAGFYLVRISAQGKTIIRKVIKQ